MGHNSTKSIQVIVGSRRAYADRLLLEPDFVKMPLNALMDDNYLKQRLISVLTGNLIFRYQEERNLQRKLKRPTTRCRSVWKCHCQRQLLMRVMVRITVMTWASLNNEMDDFSAKVEC
jgi:gamma-glutamyltranspeptidase